jgi:regulator of sigma E protease
MLGGVTVNAILGVIIFAGILMYWGEKFIPNSELKHGIVASALAQEVGLQTGDKLVSINGEAVIKFDDIMSSKVLLGSDVAITVDRNGAPVNIVLPNDFTKRLLNSDKSGFVIPRMAFKVGEVMPNMPAAEAGLMIGDEITAINGEAVSFFDELQSSLQTLKGQTIQMDVLRAGKLASLNVSVSEAGTIGFYPELEVMETSFKKYGFFESIPAGATLAWNVISDNIKGFGKVFSGDIPVEKSLGGPIAIAKKMYGGVWDWYRFWMTTGLLSMILAFMNLLPIPALDGGHVVFLLIEMAIGKPVSEKVMLAAQYVGMILVISLMVFAFGNDIWQHLLN